jgi:hypothetical protein
MAVLLFWRALITAFRTNSVVIEAGRPRTWCPARIRHNVEQVQLLFGWD